MDKNDIKQAVKELHEEEKKAAEKTASDQADAFEVGVRIFMKEAGIVDPEDQKVFMATAQQLAAGQTE